VRAVDALALPIAENRSAKRFAVESVKNPRVLRIVPSETVCQIVARRVGNAQRLFCGNAEKIGEKLGVFVGVFRFCGTFQVEEVAVRDDLDIVASEDFFYR